MVLNVGQGGESEEFSQNGAIRAICPAIGSEFHRLHYFSSSLHTATELTTFYHIYPHLSRKSFIVKRKLAGLRPTPALPIENAKACGESNQAPQGIALMLLVLSLFLRSHFS